jgi:hypothetical protein
VCACAHMSLLSITVQPNKSAGQLLCSQIWQLPLCPVCLRGMCRFEKILALMCAISRAVAFMSWLYWLCCGSCPTWALSGAASFSQQAHPVLHSSPLIRELVTSSKRAKVIYVLYPYNTAAAAMHCHQDITSCKYELP